MGTEIKSVIHFVPNMDIDQHELTITCKCAPSVKVEGNTIQVTHNSFDFREAIEEFNRIVGNENPDTWVAYSCEL